ncbi:MAG: hypothetical protein ACI84O_001045, partial [Myxococcota bacterium]
MNRIALPIVMIAILGVIGWLALSPTNRSASNDGDTYEESVDLREIGYSDARLAEIAAAQEERRLERENLSDDAEGNVLSRLDYGKASFTGTVVDPQGEPLVGIDVKMAVSRKWQYTFNPDDRNLID